MASGTTTRQILVTGPPGIGKTTLIRNVCEDLSRNFPDLGLAGFFTQETRDPVSKQRTGFEVVKLPESTNKRAPLATVAPPSVGKKLPTVGKYSVLIEEFENVAMESMNEAKECKILVLDELGKMESFSSTFCHAFTDWLKTDERAFLLATIPIAKGKALKIVEEALKISGSVTVTLNRENRDEKCDEVKKLIA